MSRVGPEISFPFNGLFTGYVSARELEAVEGTGYRMPGYKLHLLAPQVGLEPTTLRLTTEEPLLERLLKMSSDALATKPAYLTLT